MDSEHYPSSWARMTLDDLGRIVTGKTPPTKFPEYYGHDIPFITPTDMDGRKRIGKTERYLSKVGVEKVKSCLLPEGTVFVSCMVLIWEKQE